MEMFKTTVTVILVCSLAGFVLGGVGGFFTGFVVGCFLMLSSYLWCRAIFG
jgi:hypothetical protein